MGTPDERVAVNAWGSMAPTLPFLMNDKIMKATELLTEAIRQNRTALDEPLAGDEVSEWVTFARTMQPMVAAAAEFIAGVIKRAGDAGESP